MFSKNQMKIKNQMKYNIYKYYLENLVISKKSEKMNEYNEYLKLVLNIGLQQICHSNKKDIKNNNKRNTNYDKIELSKNNII